MKPQQPFKVSLLRKMIYFCIKPILSCAARIQIIGEENIPPDGKIIIASNHLSSFDGFILQIATSRQLFFMGKTEVFKNPFSAWLLKKLGVFPVRRGVYDREAIHNAFKVLNSRLALVMFPEGTRTYGKGLAPAKNGVSHIAIKAGSPIIPVTIVGAETIFKHVFKRVFLKVIIHNPIYPSTDQTPATLTEMIMRKIASQYPQPIRGVYA